MFAIDTNQWKEASVDREMLHLLLAIQVGCRNLQHDSTGAATAFATTELGSFETMLRTNKVKQGPMRVWVVESYGSAIEIEADVGGIVRCVDKVA